MDLDAGNDAGRDGGADGGNDAAGDDGGNDAGVDSGTDAGVPDILGRESRSTTIDVSLDDSLVAMVNPDDDSVSVFQTSDNTRRSKTTTGDEPSSVVFHPNGTVAFVANRGDATVVRLDGIDTATPTIGATYDVGSEPTGIALSPTGRYLYVAEWAESRVAQWDLSTGMETASFAARNPRALAVTNDGDTDDTDELVVVPEFFGTPVAEVSNTGRQGRIHVLGAQDLTASGAAITLMPVDSGFGAMPPTMTDNAAPNMLFGVTVLGSTVYVTSTSTSPEAPIAFNRNVHPIVYVADLESRTQDNGPTGTTNLARHVGDRLAMGATRFFLADIVAIAFAPDTEIAYVVSRGADVVQRVDYSGAMVTIGSTRNVQIDVNAAPGGATAGCTVPTGIEVAHDMARARAYLNCWNSRQLGVIDLADQVLIDTEPSFDPPSSAEDVAVNNGTRFFFTGRGRWSSEGWSSCGSCHPDGLTDNVTWAFGAGPRQSTSLDGSFSHGPGPQSQRIFNWTGIFDEVHDFERNTRGTSGGLGAITVPSMMGMPCSAGEMPVSIAGIGGLARPFKELQDMAGTCTNDWDEVDAYMRTIRPPRARQFDDSDAVDRGRTLFTTGNCMRCHGGPGWTLSRRFWTPSMAVNMTLTSTPFVPPAAWPMTWNDHTFQIQQQPAADDTVAGGEAPPHVSCVLRRIGTFGVPGDAGATTSLERRDSGTRAQGAGGFNIPSLYGLAVGGPYLHHGQAETLEELLDPVGTSPWREHLIAGNAVFTLTGTDRADLIAYLHSIDADAAEIAVPAGFDGCPPVFPPP